MKIAFESQLFLKGDKTGIAWYAHNIIEEIMKNQEIVGQCNYFSLFYGQTQLEELKKYERIGVHMNPNKMFSDVLYKLLWPFCYLPYKMFFGNDADITHFFNYIIPPGVSGKKVVVVHDMAYKIHPQTVRLKTRAWLNLTLKKSCNRADVIITISQFSKQEMIKYLNISEEKIKIVPCGVDKKKFNPNYSIKLIDAVKKKFGIEKEYFLYLGTLEPRKNILRLIEAYFKVLKHQLTKSFSCPQLVLAGGKGWMYQEMFSKVKELKLENYVLFTGYIDEKEVPILLNGAKAFVFPSLYEGFGMPPLEAMACGVPVITSNVSSLPEVVGNAGYLINPESTEDLMQAMLHLIQTDKDEINQIIQKGFKRVEEFTWKKSADKMIKIYNELLK